MATGSKEGRAARPSYRVVEQDLRKQIDEGLLVPGSRIPTEKELVSRYGVSITTVRRAVSELCARGMLERQQGRGTFVREQQHFVGLVCPYPGLSWAPMVESLRHELKQTNSSLRTYTYMWTDTDSFLEQAKACSAENDGMIVFLPYRTPSEAAAFFGGLETSRYPHVFLEKEPDFASSVPVVTVDYAAGFGRLIARVTRTGQRPAVLADPNHPTGAGLLDACREAGISDQSVLCGPFFEEPGIASAAVKKLLAMSPKPDVVVCPSSKVAVAVALQLRAEGVHQDDVEVTASGNMGQLAGLGEPMWILDLPRTGIGREAARCIAKMIVGADPGPGAHLPPRLTFVDVEPALLGENGGTTKTSSGLRVASAELWHPAGPHL